MTLEIKTRALDQRNAQCPSPLSNVIMNIGGRLLIWGVATLAVSTGALCHAQPPQKKPTESMMYSCANKLFLSASVSTPRRDSIPRTQVKLTDPGGREQGVNVIHARIPKSWYEVVAEVPKFPNMSTEHAVEVCAAETGEYLLTIYEHGNELYCFTVTAGNQQNVVSLPEQPRSREGRILQFKFLLKVENGEVHLTWLDENGKPQLHVIDNDW